MKSEKQLYQWDVNQYLVELQPTAEFIDYPVGNEVIRLETDGTRCRIPDEVLRTYGGKTCYERYPGGKGALATASQTGIASFVVQMFEKGAEAKNEVVRPRVFDLTLMFGAGHEPTAEQFTAMFPAESYPYNPGEIISSRTEIITAGAETITTGFPELRSTTAAHDYINMDDGQTIRNIRKIKFSELKTKEFENGVFYINHSEIGAKHFNANG